MLLQTSFSKFVIRKKQINKKTHKFPSRRHPLLTRLHAGRIDKKVCPYKCTGLFSAFLSAASTLASLSLSRIFFSLSLRSPLLDIGTSASATVSPSPSLLTNTQTRTPEPDRAPLPRTQTQSISTACLYRHHHHHHHHRCHRHYFPFVRSIQAAAYLHA